MSTFRLHISTPEADFYSGEVEYLSFETTDGRMGIMRGALSRIVILKAGRIDVKSPALCENFICGDGLVKVNSDEVAVLTSSCRACDTDGGDGSVENTQGEDLDYKYVKARITSSILRMKDKKRQGD